MTEKDTMIYGRHSVNNLTSVRPLSGVNVGLFPA